MYLCTIIVNYFNMKQKSVMMAIGALLAAIVTTGCTSTPRVLVEVVKELPSQPVEKVVVYDIGQRVPVGALPIGKVNVMEGDMMSADQCLYSNMLSLAVKKTAACGGNALHVDDHKKGGLTTKCHRIWGTMYLVPDSLLTGVEPMTVAQLEEKHDQELLEMNRKDEQNTKNASKKKKMFDNPISILKVDFGPSLMTSEIDAGSITYRRETGFVFDVGYQHVWCSGLGFGFNYLYHHTPLDSRYSITMHYVGPSFVASFKLAQHIRVYASLGIGCGFLNEDYDSDLNVYVSKNNLGKMGVSFLGQLGIEYMVTKQFGIGLQLNSYAMSLKRPKNVNTDKWGFYGVKQLDMMMGLRYYF